ncbi:MAG: hypothetical protein ACJAUH_002975 [Saprospiraceae bacterium]
MKLLIQRARLDIFPYSDVSKTNASKYDFGFGLRFGLTLLILG